MGVAVCVFFKKQSRKMSIVLICLVSLSYFTHNCLPINDRAMFQAVYILALSAWQPLPKRITEESQIYHHCDIWFRQIWVCRLPCFKNIYTYLASPAIFENSYAYWDKPRLFVSQSGFLTAQENLKRGNNEEKKVNRRRKFALWLDFLKTIKFS